MSTISPQLYSLLYTILKEDSAIWDKFENGVRYKNRFFPINDQRFFKALKKICENTIIINSGESFFRARQMDIERKDNFNFVENDKIMGFLQDDINMPPKDKAAAGRANPQNVPYLYLASNKQTACAECRCGLQDILSIMEFKITKDIKVIDLSNDNIGLKGLDKIFFYRVKKSFVDICFNKSDVFYAPTQYIASYFYNNSIMGIKYPTARESSNESYNLVLFNNEFAEPQNQMASIYICTKSLFVFNEINSPNENNFCINGNMINGQQTTMQQKEEINKKILGIRQVIKLKKSKDERI